MIKLYQGDCLEAIKGFEDNSIDCIVTDPQYGNNVMKEDGSIGSIGVKAKDIHWKPNPTKYGAQAWDKKRPDEIYFREMLRISRNQVIFGGNYFADLLPPTSCWYVWDKLNTGNFADCELIWTSFDTAVRKLTYRWNGMFQGKIQNMKKREKRVHPTQKPVPLMEMILDKCTKEGETILDPFMGSGSTGVACMNLSRNFIGCEKEEQFFTIAKDRIEAAEAQLRF